jgi:hypothetical protein
MRVLVFFLDHLLFSPTSPFSSISSWHLHSDLRFELKAISYKLKSTQEIISFEFRPGFVSAYRSEM